MKQHLSKINFVSLVTVLIFFSSALYVFSQDSVLKPKPLPISDVIVDPVYDKLFIPQERGFLGADGGASVLLGPDRVLWIFGDTILGTLRDGQRKGMLIRNSIAIQKLSKDGPGSITYYWDLTDRIPGAFFHPDSFFEPYWYWPGTGVTINGKTYLFLSKVGEGKGIGGLSFKGLGCTLFIIKNPNESPDKWDITKVDLIKSNNHFNINTASIVEGDFVYLLGHYDGPNDNPLERVAILCRIPIEKLDSAHPGDSIQYWSKGGQWLPTRNNLAPLFQPGTTESSLYYDSVHKRYITAVIRPFSPDYYIFTAEKLTGPWSEPQKIYNIPDLQRNKLYHAYAGRLHPMLPCKPNELVLSYVVNTTDFWSMFSALDIYYPRFIRIRFETP
ncbi:DUF4185 domain-containing protein [Candidatus Sumerlaeota bacterium]|nr:DUF4185 domain-containing protein [Candidatus Sumerlaeota bacterium]